MRLFMFSSIACPSQDEDLRVVHEPVGYGCGHSNSSGVEDLSPVSEGQVLCKALFYAHCCSVSLDSGHFWVIWLRIIMRA